MSTLHTELHKLREAEAAELTSARQLEADLTAATSEAEDARTALVEATASGTAAKARTADKGRDAANSRVDDLQIQVEAAELRAQRAARARWEFEATNAKALIGEMEAEAVAVAERMTAHAEGLVADHNAWHAINQAVGRLLALNPATSPRGNALDDHPYAGVVRDLRRALGDHGPVPAPLPHMQRYEFERRQEEDAVRARAQRDQANPDPAGAEGVAI
jgi:hypothetical protein